MPCTRGLLRVPRKRLTSERFDPPLMVKELVWLQGRAQMAWKAPKVVEVSVGMEINMYLCADPQLSGSESPSAIAGLSY